MSPVRWRVALVVLVAATLGACADSRLPEGYWNEKTTRAILDKTIRIRLDPDLSQLTERERVVVPMLLEVGQILQRCYEMSRHPQSQSGYEALIALHEAEGHSQATQNLIDLYRIAKGPTIRGLDSKVEPFLPVDPKAPGRNVYPWQITRDEVDAFLADHPEEREQLLHVRSVVRRADAESIQGDLDRLSQYEVLRALHPRLQEELEALLEAPDPKRLYAVPYALAYADDFVRVNDILNEAAETIQPNDADFARYLRHRGLDLLRNDYEAGDAAWVTGRFNHLNAQIGAYETYDDELYGIKSFLSMSLLVEDPAMTSSLNTVVKWLQEMEDLLPYEPHKQVRQDIPIGAYNVVADFGQSRGTNTASILPNESYITRKYGRTILLRYNIMTNPELFAIRKAAYEAAVEEEFHAMYETRGDYFRTLWHEIGHYLGPDETRDGRTIEDALEEDHSILEELKADLISLFVCKRLDKKGYYDTSRLRAVQASGVRRTLNKSRPRKSQVYSTMELMQMNYYLEKGLLSYDAKKNKLRIDVAQYHPAVESMLREVLALQYEGDKAAADRFIEAYSTWDDDVHGRIAKAMIDTEKYRYALVRYAALGE